MEHRRLGDVVPADVGLDTQPTHRRHVDDRAPQPGLDRRRCPEEHRQQIDFEDLLGPRHVEVDHRAEIGVRPGVVHQHVDAAEPRHGRLHAHLRVLGVSHMGGGPGHPVFGHAGGHQPARCLGQVVGGARAQHHVGAGLGEACGRRQTDAAARAGDQRRPSCQCELHRPSLARVPQSRLLALASLP